MAIVGAFDVHRRQITFDYVDTETGQVRRGRVQPACRGRLREFLGRFAGRDDVAFAVEACTGWRFVVEELERAGIAAHLAEPAETAAARGPKRRAKTDGADARLARELLADGRLPLSWIPPAQVREIRVKLELYKDLRDEHTAWVQRVHATLFHQGVPAIGEGGLGDPAARARLAAGEGLSAAGAQAVRVALRMLDTLERELDALHRELAAFSRAQRGCKQLAAQYGVGPITSVAIWAMMGDARRFSASRKAVRHTGLDVTVHSSDGKRAAGRLSRQGPPVLRWALYEAGYCAARRTSPDHAYYTAVRERIDGNRAALSMARKIARRSHHILRELGDAAFEPVPD
jgi:transposase